MTNFKDIVYFPSFSAGLAGYYIKGAKFRDELDYKFFDDSYPKEYQHKYFLLTAGHLYKKMDVREKMGLNNGSLVIGDSGGFQIASGALAWSPDLREKIFNWLEANSDIAVNLDIPPRLTYEGRFEECLKLSYDNFKWFNEHQTGKTEFLGVLQGYNVLNQYETWYNKVKGFDFNGWCIGGGDSIARMLYAFAVLLKNKEFENKNNKSLHFLGQTKVSDFLIYTMMQKGFDTHGMEHVQVMTDSSTPVQFPIYGNAIWGADYMKMCYKLLYFPGGKKKSMYKDDTMMPTYFDTPVQKYLNFGLIKEYTTEVRHLLAYHNLYAFKQIMREVKSLCGAHIEVLDGVIHKGFYTVCQSIEKMFKDPKNALNIFEAHKQLYEKLSSQLEPQVSTKTVNSLFTDDEDDDEAEEIKKRLKEDLGIISN